MPDNIYIYGEPDGRYNIVDYDHPLAVPFNTYSDKLCAIQTHTDTKSNLIEYRPQYPLSPITQFVPGSGYVVVAHQSFVIYGPTPTPTPSPSPSSSPSPTPSRTPSPTPSPTPSSTPLVFLYSLTGPDNEDGAQKINIFSSQYADTIYYNGWDGQNTDFCALEVVVNGQSRCQINYTADRVGKQFGYKLQGASGSFQAVGVFTPGSTGVVNFTIAFSL